MCLCFIDYIKAFERVRDIIKMLEKLHTYDKDMKIIENICCSQRAAKCANSDTAEYQEIK